MSHEATHDKVRELLDGTGDPTITRLLEGTDGWSISEAAAQSLFRLVLALQPHSVLEFGAGWSSLVIGLALERLGGRRRLTSLDTTADYCREPWRRLEELRDVDAALAISPIGLRLGREGLSFGYRGVGRAGRSRGPFDFVFIDAPPNRYGRYGTLFAARPFLQPGSIVGTRRRLAAAGNSSDGAMDAMPSWPRVHRERPQPGEGAGCLPCRG